MKARLRGCLRGAGVLGGAPASVSAELAALHRCQLMKQQLGKTTPYRKRVPAEGERASSLFGPALVRSWGEGGKEVPGLAGSGSYLPFRPAARRTRCAIMCSGPGQKKAPEHLPDRARWECGDSELWTLRGLFRPRQSASLCQSAFIWSSSSLSEPALGSSFHRHVGALGGASVELARPADAL